MPIPSGSRFGSYEILALLGAGGMGEVYRAQDSRLGRMVAMKALPEAWATDPDRSARLEREARVLASLNHPHIAALYGVEEADGRQFLVMELVEGETLADRLARGPMAVRDALDVARQILEALEAAHERGIVHRDLKPANVKITPEDRVKVLDFGLARLQDKSEPGAAPNVTHSPTLSLMATQAGVILGTAGYMSPEQAKGAVTDHRSDLFSFGAVFYEMLTGRRAFHAETAAETMAAVLMREPDFGALPPGVDPRVTTLLRRCLEKHPKRRWHAAGDVRAEIESVIQAPASAAAHAHRPLWQRAIPYAVTAVVAAGAALGGAWLLRPGPAPQRPQVVRFPIVLTEEEAFTNSAINPLTISRDGTRIVYSVNGRLWVRALSAAASVPIPGVEQTLAAAPTFAPDDQSFAFVSGSDGTLKKVAASGGAPQTLTPIQSPISVSWAAHDAIFFTQPAGIMRVSAGGGTPLTILQLSAGERAFGPELLPDGKTLLFTLLTGAGAGAWDTAQIVALSLDSGSRTTILNGGNPRYLRNGRLVYARNGILFGVPFDPVRLETSGDPVTVLEGVAQNPVAGSLYAVSDTGTLVYLPGRAITTASSQLSTLTIVDEDGTLDTLKLDPRPYESPRISPDGKRIAFGLDDGREASLWIYNLDGATSPRRLTFLGNNRFPVWSPDSREIVFQSSREGDLGLFRQSADVSGAAAERLTTAEAGNAHVPESWSGQNGALLFSAVGRDTATLWSYSMKARKAERFSDVQSTSALNAEFSPDGKWIAYTLRGGPGQVTIYVEPFPPTGQRQIASLPNELAHHPIWHPDGNTLFYIPGARPLAAVAVVREPSLAFGNPGAWAGRLPNVNPFGLPRNFDITPDGKRFLFARSEFGAGAGGAPQIQVVVNWSEELRERLPDR